MSTRVFRCELESRSVRRVTDELMRYRRELPQKAEKLRRLIAEYIAEGARAGFASAIVDDLIGGGARNAHVDVTVGEKGQTSVVIANGEDAIWCEFGAGVYHNGSVGSSPHPKGSELGFTIGDYGNGNGRKRVWGFYEDGELRLTHGTPASMPMYSSMTQVCSEIARIAQEVFV